MSREAQAMDLHVCSQCSGTLVYPVEWSEEGPGFWRVRLRCPDCNEEREGVFERRTVERLDDELDRGTSSLLADLRRVEHSNMSEEAERFEQALESDAILPEDF